MMSSMRGPVGDHLHQELANYGPWAKPSLLPVFGNKVVLGSSHTHPATYCLWLLLHYKIELSSCDRDCMSGKAKIIIIWLFTQEIY